MCSPPLNRAVAGHSRRTICREDRPGLGDLLWLAPSEVSGGQVAFGDDQVGQPGQEGDYVVGVSNANWASMPVRAVWVGTKTASHRRRVTPA